MKQVFHKLLALTLCAALCLGCVAATGCASRGVSPDGPAAGTPTTQTPQNSQPAAQPETPSWGSCDPLTGALLAEDAPTPTRPVAVMIDNAQAALPQSGIAAASVVYEMVTEAGIPRMMAVFANTSQLHRVGPVRSTRDQFVQVLVPENMMLLHIGSSIYATDMLRKLEYPTVDGIYLGTVSFAFDEARAQTKDNSHCFYTDSLLADAGLAQQGISPEGAVLSLFNFADPTAAPLVPASPAAQVDFSFSAVAAVSFAYNAETGKYYKSEYGAPQMDEFTGEQLSYTNLLLLADTVELKSDGLCTDYQLDKGTGYYFTQGGYQPVTWEKGDERARLTVYDETGAPLTVNVGTSYIAMLDTRALQRSLTVDGAALSGE